MAHRTGVRAALTNENSYPVPPEVVADMLAELGETLPGLNRYPDREFTDLRSALAAYLSRGGEPIDPVQVWAAMGPLTRCSCTCSRAWRPRSPRHRLHPVPFGCTRSSRRRRAPRGRTADAAPSPAFVHARRGGCGGATGRPRPAGFICSPNNPTGTAVGLDVIEAAYEAAPALSSSSTRPMPSSLARHAQCVDLARRARAAGCHPHPKGLRARGWPTGLSGRRPRTGRPCSGWSACPITSAPRPGGRAGGAAAYGHDAVHGRW